MAEKKEPKIKIRIKSNKQPEKIADAFKFLASTILTKTKAETLSTKNR